MPRPSRFIKTEHGSRDKRVIRNKVTKRKGPRMENGVPHWHKYLPPRALEKVKAAADRKRSNAVPAEVSVQFKHAIQKQIEDYCRDKHTKELVFDSNLTSEERKYIHQYVLSVFGLKSHSRGKAANRRLTVSKLDKFTEDSIPDADTGAFRFTDEQVADIQTYFTAFPQAASSSSQSIPQKTNFRSNRGASPPPHLRSGYVGCRAPPQLPQPSNSDAKMWQMRVELPIFEHRDNLLQLIYLNRVSLIVGETGCGKTTQVPQYLLESHNQSQHPCRMIVVQPRRIAAISAAERVASERGESVGQGAIGYQVRLQKSVCRNTIVTFCTTGILLRALMGDRQRALEGVTHILIDEVHERSREMDFLLIAVRDLLRQRTVQSLPLHIVLMSANLDVDLFAAYFETNAVYNVPTRTYEVAQLYLEDALRMTGFVDKELDDFRRSGHLNVKEEPQEEEEAEVNEEADELLARLFQEYSEEKMNELVDLVKNGSLDVNYAHSTLGMTPLMVAAGRGYGLAVARLLVVSGCDLRRTANNGFTALDFARRFKHVQLAEMIEAALAKYATGPASCSTQRDPNEDYAKVYNSIYADDSINYDLVLSVMRMIVDNPATQKGAVLVFVAGFEDIVSLRDQVTNDPLLGDTSRFGVYILHSNMQTADQRRVFERNPKQRKLIIATNIAEASITIEDVVFVIDCGKVKEVSYDNLMDATGLRAVWISKANAQQRRGRAGRCQPGVCFHLFSKAHYAKMPESQVPEMLRTPVHDLCLQSKKMIGDYDECIADFLSRAPDAPTRVVLDKAVALLKTIGALDARENLTQLGEAISQLPLQPQHAKMLLYALALRCIEPILILVSMLSYRDPFFLPWDPEERAQAWQRRRRLSSDTASDHAALIAAFVGWERAWHYDGDEGRRFCHAHTISKASMEMIFGIREQLVEQLRDSGLLPSGTIDTFNSKAASWPTVKAAIVSGLYPNIAHLQREPVPKLRLLDSRTRCSLSLHRASCVPSEPFVYASKTNRVRLLGGLPGDWLMFHELNALSDTRCTLKAATVVNAPTVALCAGLTVDVAKPIRIEVWNDTAHCEPSQAEDEDATVGVTIDDGAVHMCLPLKTANLVVRLRERLQGLVNMQLSQLLQSFSRSREREIEATLDLLIHVLELSDIPMPQQQPSSLQLYPASQQPPVEALAAARPAAHLSYAPPHLQDEYGILSSGSSQPFGFYGQPAVEPQQQQRVQQQQGWSQQQQTTFYRSKNAAAGSRQPQSHMHHVASEPQMNGFGGKPVDGFGAYAYGNTQWRHY